MSDEHRDQRDREREKHGVRLAVAWLHARAAEMVDPHAKAVLDSAAANLGKDLAAGRLRSNLKEINNAA